MTEIEQSISQIERGTVVTKFFPRKRPEKKTLMLKRETRQIVWSRNSTSRPYDGSGKIYFWILKKLMFFNFYI